MWALVIIVGILVAVGVGQWWVTRPLKTGESVVDTRRARGRSDVHLPPTTQNNDLGGF